MGKTLAIPQAINEELAIMGVNDIPHCNMSGHGDMRLTITFDEEGTSWSWTCPTNSCGNYALRLTPDAPENPNV